MKFKLLAYIMGTFLSVSLVSYQLDNYESSKEYSIKFVTSQAEGTLAGLKGEVSVDEDNLSNSVVNVSVDVATINTGNTTKDDHAKGTKWFDAPKYPQIRFRSTSLAKTSSGLVAIGQLTIKDVTKQISIPFKFDPSGIEMLLIGSLSVNRKDYNINGNLFGFAVGKQVDIELRVPAKFDQ